MSPSLPLLAGVVFRGAITINTFASVLVPTAFHEKDLTRCEESLFSACHCSHSASSRHHTHSPLLDHRQKKDPAHKKGGLGKALLDQAKNRI